MAITLKRKGPVDEPAPEPVSPDAATPPGQAAAPPPPEPAAPKKSGASYALACIFAIAAVILFAALIFLQWKELSFYTQ